MHEFKVFVKYTCFIYLINRVQLDYSLLFLIFLQIGTSFFLIIFLSFPIAAYSFICIVKMYLQLADNIDLETVTSWRVRNTCAINHFSLQDFLSIVPKSSNWWRLRKEWRNAFMNVSLLFETLSSYWNKKKGWNSVLFWFCNNLYS